MRARPTRPDILQDLARYLVLLYKCAAVILSMHSLAAASTFPQSTLVIMFFHVNFFTYKLPAKRAPESFV